MMENVESEVNEIKDMINANCNKHLGPMSDIASGQISKTAKRNSEFEFRDLVTAMALCHNVTPIWEEGRKEPQGSSPDEVSLVKYAEELGIELMERRVNDLILRNAAGETEEYEILQMFPFSSATKRMGIIIQHKDTQRIIFYLKGAEDTMKTKVGQRYMHIIEEQCSDLAREGLRTLVMTQKLLSAEEYQAWKKLYDEAKISIGNREEAMRNVIEQLEFEMSYLGVTGVEDQLQTNVAAVISQMRESGIACWMITGDKVETAQCIAIAAGLKSATQRFFTITDVHTREDIDRALMEFSGRNNEVLVIDGNTINLAFEVFPKHFVEVATSAPAVVCCRVSPTQKATIVEMIKKYTKMRICAIGDGGNDVGMIQEAHVGIGIVGKEGMQAALAADFQINEFGIIEELILWHGRLSYKRTAKLGQFVFHRGLVIAVIQAVFVCLVYYVTLPIFNGMLMLGYTTIYTTLPVLSLVLDEDTERSAVKQFPPLYKTLQKGRMLNFTQFWIWLWKSVYQGCMIMLLSLILFEDTEFFNIIAITFSALILTEWLNIVTEIEKWHWLMVASLLTSFVTYLCSILFMTEYFDVAFIFSLGFLWRVALITAASWGPMHFIKILIDKISPAEHMKVR